MPILLFNSKSGEAKLIKYPNRKDKQKEVQELLKNGFKIVAKTHFDRSFVINYSIFFCETHKRYECLYYVYPASYRNSFKRDLLFKIMDIVRDCKYIEHKREKEDETIFVDESNSVIYPASEEKFLTLIRKLKERNEDALLFAFINFLEPQYLAFDYAKKRIENLNEKEIEVIKEKVKIGLMEHLKREELEIITYPKHVSTWTFYYFLKDFYKLKILDTNSYFEEVFQSIKKFLKENKSLIDESFRKEPNPFLVKMLYEFTDDPRYLKYAL
jgi:hypothetical protein